MKKFREKTVLFFTAIGLLVYLTACTPAEDPENLFEMPVLQSPETPEAEKQETEQEIEFVLTEEYQYGNMQKNAPPGNFMNYGDQILFFRFMDNGHGYWLLYTLDKATGKVSPFCKDATCQHDSVACVAAQIYGNLEQYNGEIYAQTFYGSAIAQLKDGRFEQCAKGDVYNFWHADNRLYAVSRDNSLVVLEDGKERVLIDEYTGVWDVVFDNYLYGCNSMGVHRIDLLAKVPQVEIIVPGDLASMIDGEYIYYVDFGDEYRLYRCNMDGSNPVQLTEKGVLRASMNFDDDYMYFRYCSSGEFSEDADERVRSKGEQIYDVYRMSKSNPEIIEKIAQLPDNVFDIYTVPGYDKIFVVARSTEDYTIDRYYMVNKDGSGVELLTFPDE